MSPSLPEIFAALRPTLGHANLGDGGFGRLFLRLVRALGMTLPTGCWLLHT